MLIILNVTLHLRSSDGGLSGVWHNHSQGYLLLRLKVYAGQMSVEHLGSAGQTHRHFKTSAADMRTGDTSMCEEVI